MSDLIRREEAIDYFVTNIGIVDADGYAVDDYDERVKIWTESFSGIPSAETERKKGRWEVQPSTGEDRPFIWWKCSECGHVIFSETERDRKEFHAFCGRCGADMRGDR
jgi:hypothetical protein